MRKAKLLFVLIILISDISFSKAQTFTANELESGMLDDNFPNPFCIKIQKRGFLRSLDIEPEDSGTPGTGALVREYKLLDNGKHYVDAFITATLINGSFDLKTIYISYYENAKSDYDAITFFIRKGYTKEKEFYSKKSDFVEIYSTSMHVYFAITKHATDAGVVTYDIRAMNLEAYKDYLVRY